MLSRCAYYHAKPWASYTLNMKTVGHAGFLVVRIRVLSPCSVASSAVVSDSWEQSHPKRRNEETKQHLVRKCAARGRSTGKGFDVTTYRIDLEARYRAIRESREQFRAALFARRGR